MVEPLFPRLGLLGGSPEAGGKVSKLAALAAKRKQKDEEKAPVAKEAPATPQTEGTGSSSVESSAPRSLRERLATTSKSPKPSEGLAGLRRKPETAASPVTKKPSAPKPEPEKAQAVPENHAAEEPSDAALPGPSAPNMRAPPSMFASAIVGNASGPTAAEPSHLQSNNVDLLDIYGQSHAEPFDFADPSPDDVVLNAQNTAKGLAIRRKV